MRRLGLLGIAVMLAACSGPVREPEPAKLAATLRLGWIPSGSFAGEVTGMRRYAADYGLKLEIKPGGPSLNTVTLVASGQDTFGTLAADEVLLANENGADLVIVGVINDVSPGGFVTLKASGIESPKDFPGHTVGVLPFGSTTLLFEAMLEVNDVDRSQIREVTISPDLRPFIEGVYDVHPVFVYDETVTLDQIGVSYNLIEPKNFGVDFKGPVYFTRRAVVDGQPDLVEAFIRIMVKGWNDALGEPEAAIQMLKEFAPEIDAERELQVLRKGAEYFRAYRAEPVNSDRESWTAMAQLMVDFGRLKKLPDLDKVIRLDWVNSVYQEGTHHPPEQMR